MLFLYNHTLDKFERSTDLCHRASHIFAFPGDSTQRGCITSIQWNCWKGCIVMVTSRWRTNGNSEANGEKANSGAHSNIDVSKHKSMIWIENTKLMQLNEPTMKAKIKHLQRKDPKSGRVHALTEMQQVGMEADRVAVVTGRPRPKRMHYVWDVVLSLSLRRRKTPFLWAGNINTFMNKIFSHMSHLKVLCFTFLNTKTQFSQSSFTSSSSPLVVELSKYMKWFWSAH